MKSITRKEQITLWKKGKQHYKGDIIAKTVLTISKDYIGQNCIDIGSGSGALLKEFNKTNKEKKIIGIDLVPKTKEILKRDCTNTKFEASIFDTLFCTDVIEHLNDEDLKKFSREANRIMGNGGYGIFTTINNENLEEQKVTCPKCEYEFHRWGHCQRFNEQKVIKIFKEKGFKIVEIKELNLNLLSRHPVKMKLFYFTGANNFFNFNFPTSDLFFVAKKVKEIT